MVRLVCVLILLLPFFVKGQKDATPIIKEGLLRGQGTFSFGNLPKIKETGLYLHGNLEYYFDNQFSMRGDVFYHLKSDNFSWLDMNHQLYAGISWHCPECRGNFKPYMGIQPGIALTKSSPIVALESGTSSFNLPTEVTFLYSNVIGFNYYAEDWFHLFVDARMIIGEHKGDYNINIAEFRLSFGLGFNINTK